MKVSGVVVFVFLLSVSSIVSTDLLLGFSLYDALSRLKNPFWVIEPGEYVMLGFLLVLIIGQQIFLIMKSRYDKQNGSN